MRRSLDELRNRSALTERLRRLPELDEEPTPVPGAMTAADLRPEEGDTSPVRLPEGFRPPARLFDETTPSLLRPQPLPPFPLETRGTAPWRWIGPALIVSMLVAGCVGLLLLGR